MSRRTASEPSAKPMKSSQRKTVLEGIEIEELEKRIQHLSSSSSHLARPADEKNPESAGADEEDETSFASRPISRATLAGLKRGKFLKMTPIQASVLNSALCGRDILGAAKTGSGKTLAFLIPLVEDLYRNKWSRDDGLGAIVIAPTRELVTQIDEVLRVVVSEHSFKTGCLVGGVPIDAERRMASKLQIAVGTPGRLLQHFSETQGFECAYTLRVLVLDEADRLLDMGFAEQLESILDYLPAPRKDGGTRQTMLFSATQTKKISDLARLSLKDPEFVDVDGQAPEVTPVALKQNYMVVPLEQKIDALWTFLRTHTLNRTIVFLSSCKQVKFAEAAFRKLGGTGVVVLALHGKMKPAARAKVYDRFCSWPRVALLATDVAARGLDFPDVDWVLQADCPEDVATYIHRAGRTARYKSGGNAQLFLLPTEAKGFLPQLEKNRVPVKPSPLNAKWSVKSKLAAIIAADPELKASAQAFYKSYLRSIHLQTDRTVFVDVPTLPLEAFAASLGMAAPPKAKFITKGASGQDGRDDLRSKKAKDREAQLMESLYGEPAKKKSPSRTQFDSDDDEEEDAREEVEASASEGSDRSEAKEGDDDDDDDFLKPVAGNARDIDREAPAKPVAKKVVADPARRVKISATGVAKEARGQRVVFEDDDQEEASTMRVEGTASYIDDLAARLREGDVEDKRLDRERIREQRRAKRAKASSGDDQERFTAVLASAEPRSDDEDDDDNDSEGSGEERQDFEDESENEHSEEDAQSSGQEQEEEDDEEEQSSEDDQEDLTQKALELIQSNRKRTSTGPQSGAKRRR